MALLVNAPVSLMQREAVDLAFDLLQHLIVGDALDIGIPDAVTPERLRTRHRSCGTLDGVTTILPATLLFLDIYVRKEALQCLIECSAKWVRCDRPSPCRSSALFGENSMAEATIISQGGETGDVLWAVRGQEKPEPVATIALDPAPRPPVGGNGGRRGLEVRRP